MKSYEEASLHREVITILILVFLQSLYLLCIAIAVIQATRKLFTFAIRWRLFGALLYSRD